MKNLFTLLLISLFYSNSDAKGFDWGSALKGAGRAQDCISRGGNPLSCAGNEVDRTNPTQAKSLTLSYGEGRGDSVSECEQNARQAAEDAAVFKCTQDFGRSCTVISGRTRITRPPSNNPATTIGGLSGKKLICSASAAAQVDR